MMNNNKRRARLEERRILAQRRFSIKYAKKIIGRLFLSTILYLIMVAAEVTIGFIIWNHFYPTTDLLEFVGWVIILGTIAFILTGAAIEENFKHWYNRAKMSAKIRRRQINRFFSYEKESLK